MHLYFSIQKYMYSNISTMFTVSPLLSYIQHDLTFTNLAVCTNQICTETKLNKQNAKSHYKQLNLGTENSTSRKMENKLLNCMPIVLVTTDVSKFKHERLCLVLTLIYCSVLSPLMSQQTDCTCIRSCTIQAFTCFKKTDLFHMKEPVLRWNI